MAGEIAQRTALQPFRALSLCCASSGDICTVWYLDDNVRHLIPPISHVPMFWALYLPYHSTATASTLVLRHCVPEVLL
jgi:hypothetical protein